MTRIAKNRPVVFIEEPVRAAEGESEGWELQRPAPKLLIARPRTPIEAPGFHPDHI
jgi:hypothetical protein